MCSGELSSSTPQTKPAVKAGQSAQSGSSGWALADDPFKATKGHFPKGSVAGLQRSGLSNLLAAVMHFPKDYVVCKAQVRVRGSGCGLGTNHTSECCWRLLKTIDIESILNIHRLNPCLAVLHSQPRGCNNQHPTNARL